MARKKNIISRMQTWMDSRPGQMFLNYAYSWGASIVILGALFKLTHIAGADLMLFLGMGTEVFVFFLAGFERPYDEVKPENKDKALKAEEATDAAAGDAEGNATGDAAGNLTTGNMSAGNATVVIGGGIPAGGTIIMGSNAEQASAETTGGTIDPAQLANAIATSPAMSAQFAGMCPEMQEATQTYVDQLKELTEILKKVAEQSARLTRDSEEMETMNRTLTGINRFYEMQLRSVGTQSATIDTVNEQTNKLAAQLEELNRLYARMVEALKVNITGPATKSE
jgi:gliding motility-associated protein GldL